MEQKSNLESEPHHVLGLIQTGGTIASVKTSDGLNLATDDVITNLLEQQSKNYIIKNRSPYRILSENAEPQNWLLLFRTITDLISDGVDGIVITHGTDTMLYTAAALCLGFWGHPPVPIVLTGSMLPADDPLSDGKANLRWSVEVVMSPDAPKEIMIVMSGSSREISTYWAGESEFLDRCGDVRLLENIIRASRAKKISAWMDYFSPLTRMHAAFESHHEDLLGVVTESEKLLFNPNVRTLPEHDNVDALPSLKLDNRVIPFQAYPGMKAQLITDLIEKDDYKGIVLQGYGDGTLPAEKLMPVIKMVTEKGAIICVTTQLPLGPATLGIYAGSQDLIQAGAIPLDDMTPEFGVVKLMWALANTKSPEEARKLMRKNIAGEISTSQPEDLIKVREITSIKASQE